MKRKSCLQRAALAVLLALGLGVSAQAETISVVAQTNGITANSGSDGSGLLFTTDNFDLNGGEAAVLYFSSKGWTTTNAPSATFAGQSMNAVFVAQGNVQSTIFYLINPLNASGAFEVTIDPNLSLKYAYSQLSLDNALSVVTNLTVASDVTDTNTPIDLSYTTTENGFVVGAIANATYAWPTTDPQNGPLSIAYGNLSSNVLPFTVIENDGGHLHAYGEIDSAGSYTDGYLGQYKRTAVSSVIFSPTAATGADSDGDGLLDSEEISGSANGAYDNDPTDPNDSDSDDDGLNDGEECLLQGTNPNSADTDLDGLDDGYEVNTSATNPLDEDSDNDGLADGEEVDTYSTDPNAVDSDSDGWYDGEEVTMGSDPADDEDYPAPSDIITVANSYTNYGTASGVISTNFDMAGGSALVLVLTAENAASASASFSGVPMTEAVTATDTGAGAQKSRVFYMISPASETGDIAINIDEGALYAYSLLSLNNVNSYVVSATAGSTSSDNETPLDVTYTVATTNNFVVAGMVNNDWDGSMVFSNAYGKADEILFDHIDSGSSGHYHCYGDVYLPGTFTDGYYGQYQRTAIACAVFSATGSADLDSDGDGISDDSETSGEENVNYNNEPTDPGDSDSDDDGLGDGQEILVYFTDPNSADTDADGLDDGYELDTFGSDPLLADTDEDGLSDSEEDAYSTNPNSYDSDGDRWTDLEEVTLGSDANNSNNVPVLPAGSIDVAASDVVMAGVVEAGESNLLLTTDSFDLNGGSAAVLVMTAERSSTYDWAEPSATFAGEDMTAFVAQYGAQQATVFYLINPAASSGAFEVYVDGNGTNAAGTVAYTMLSLYNVNSVVTNNAYETSSTANTTPAEITYRTETTNCYVVVGAVNNDYNSARPLSVAYGCPDTDLLPHTMEGSSGHFHTVGGVLYPKSYTDGYYGQYQRTAIASVVFSADVGGPENAPVITSISVSGSDVTLSWTADNAGSYSIQRKTALSSGSWTDVETGLPAGGGSATVTASGEDAEFYQIIGE